MCRKLSVMGGEICRAAGVPMLTCAQALESADREHQRNVYALSCRRQLARGEAAPVLLPPAHYCQAFLGDGREAARLLRGVEGQLRWDALRCLFRQQSSCAGCLLTSLSCSMCKPWHM